MTVGLTSWLTAGFQTPQAPTFNRYQGILQRMPFGPPPPDPGSVVAVEDTQSAAHDLRDQQLLARQINMSCVNITPSGKPAVGFTDLSSKPPVNYYILVGGDAGGWTLKSASYSEEWAELEKDGITIFVKLGQGLMAEPPVKAAKPQVASRAKLPLMDGDQNIAKEQQTKKEPVFKTLTEQMISIATPSAPGAIVPPLPNVAISEDDLVKAMETQQELHEDDNDNVLLSKATVEEQKELMAKHIVDEGGSASSYLHRLRRRHLEEQLRQKQEELEQQQQMSSVARQAVQEAVKNREIMLLEEALRENQALDDAQAQ